MSVKTSGLYVFFIISRQVLTKILSEVNNYTINGENKMNFVKMTVVCFGLISLVACKADTQEGTAAASATVTASAAASAAESALPAASAASAAPAASAASAAPAASVAPSSK